MITVIGRGHSGTRSMSHTLLASGVFMGNDINRSGDLVPPQDMYDACRIMAQYVQWNGELSWDFSALHTMPIPQEFTELIERYLQTVLRASAPRKGWKIPETTLILPWIVRMFPEIKYIYWVRNPRDCILGNHGTDDMKRFGIEYPAISVDATTSEAQRRDSRAERYRRAISWKYQFDLMQATPRPKQCIEVRFEDLVQKRDETLARLSEFLGFPLNAINMRPDSVGRYLKDEGVSYFDFFAPAMEYHGYEIPEERIERG